MKKKQKQVRYPWDRWFKRKEFFLVFRRDYHCMAHGMSTQIRTAAIARGLRVGVHIDHDLTITVTRKPPKKRKRR